MSGTGTYYTLVDMAGEHYAVMGKTYATAPRFSLDGDECDLLCASESLCGEIAALWLELHGCHVKPAKHPRWGEVPA